MWNAERVIAHLRATEELWEPAPGLTGLRGRPLELLRGFERMLLDACLDAGGQDWRLAGGIPTATLARADYFASFPQWLTVASHLVEGPATLQRVATETGPHPDLAGVLAPPVVALPPAACYAVYEALGDSTLEAARHVTVQQCCWRHEGERVTPLEREWAFTMREIVCLGAEADVQDFRASWDVRISTFAERLGLRARSEPAADPFFAPSARGRALLQRIKGLKTEYLLPMGEGRWTAAASSNHHETFFGERFRIRLADGTAARTGCVAFGLERWTLAFLVAHGPDERNWPADAEIIVAEAAT